MLLIPLTLEGVERKLLKNSGVNASGSTLITFDEVRVPAKYLLGKENQGEVYQTKARERLSNSSIERQLLNPFPSIPFPRFQDCNVKFQPRKNSLNNPSSTYVKNLYRRFLSLRL